MPRLRYRSHREVHLPPLPARCVPAVGEDCSSASHSSLPERTGPRCNCVELPVRPCSQVVVRPCNRLLQSVSGRSGSHRKLRGPRPNRSRYRCDSSRRSEPGLRGKAPACCRRQRKGWACLFPWPMSDRSAMFPRRSSTRKHASPAQEPLPGQIFSDDLSLPFKPFLYRSINKSLDPSTQAVHLILYQSLQNRNRR